MLRKGRRLEIPPLALLVTAFAATVMCVAAAVTACATSSTTTLITTTGVVVRADTLTADRGCGTAPSNVFKYAVVVYGLTPGPGDAAVDVDASANYQTTLVSNVFDCFTDGAFVGLPLVADSATYRLEVYAYNQATYLANQNAILGATGANTKPGTGTADTLHATAPNWTTDCRASQANEVETVAVCTPVLPGLAGLGGIVPATNISVATETFTLAGGTVVTCDPQIVVPVPPDAGSDADAGDGGSDAASDAGIADAGADADAGTDSGTGADAGVATGFAVARLRWRTASQVGPTVDVHCPATATLPVPADPASYTIDVGLLDSVGTPITTTSCSAAVTVSGTTSSAVCNTAP